MDSTQNDPSVRIQTPRPEDSRIGSPESRAAARALLLTRPLQRPLPLGDLDGFLGVLPTYEELRGDWKDEGDRYTREEYRDDIVITHEVYKDSDAFRHILAQASKASEATTDRDET